MKQQKYLPACNMFLFCMLAVITAMPAMAATKFRVNGEVMTANRHRLYVNDKKKTNRSAFTFQSVGEALRYAESVCATDTSHIDIYIEPSVYWLDNPDDTAVRRPRTGTTPFAMELSISNVTLTGLSTNAEDIVLAVNRGQTQGADGNYTMFLWKGHDVKAENITFGNYCNVDLVYKPDPRKNRARRKDAIVQAQLAICQGDRFSFNNCRFISRLNLCPFVGAPHTDYHDCYFECTDDALCGTGTYRNCRFTLFSSKPFYTTDARIGARFYDCDIHSKTQGTQYLTKVSGPVVMERCRWTSDDPALRIEWNKRPDPRHYCVMTDCTLNGKPLDVPTPTAPLPVSLPPFCLQTQTKVTPGQWTIDCHKPSDTSEYPWHPDTTHAAWAYAEGVDGAEGSWGLVQVQKGARLMYTPSASESPTEALVVLDPCKGPGQGFGSATGQYLDICIKFDTQSLTGYGLRFIRTPDYDHAVVTYLVEYANGIITPISQPQRSDLFKRGCHVHLQAKDGSITANIKQGDGEQTLTALMPHPATCGGFHLQHTGSTGASATVIKSIMLK